MGSILADSQVLDSTENHGNPQIVQLVDRQNSIGCRCLRHIRCRIGMLRRLIACQSQQYQQHRHHTSLHALSLHQGLQQQSDEPSHEEIDDGRDEEREESVERARTNQIRGARHVGHGNVAHDARALQQTDNLALIDGHHGTDHLWQHNTEERLPLRIA